MNTVTKQEVMENMKDVFVTTLKPFGKPETYVAVRMKNGFTVRDCTTCVDPKNYSEDIGKGICLEHIEDKIWMLLGYELQYQVSAKNQELASTRNMMISEDYKERFKAEYIQLKNRYEGLNKMIDAWDKDELSFTPTCPRSMYNEQLAGMKQYLDVLKERAKIENVSLD